MVRGAMTQWLLVLPPLLSIVAVGGGATMASPPALPLRAPDLRSSLAPADGQRLLADEAANWDIHFLRSTTEMHVNRTDEIFIHYDVGKGRAYSAEILASGCVGDLPGMEVNAMDPVRAPKDAEYDSLSLGYRLDKTTSVAGTDLRWPSVVAFCHVLELVLPANETVGRPAFVVNKDVREFEVKVIELFNFSIGLKDPNAPVEIEMNILGWVNFTNFVDGGLANDALKQTLEYHIGNVTAAMGQGQEVASVTIVTYEVEDCDSSYFYELVLREPCHIDCEVLLNRTTMHENVTDHMAEVFDDGSFLVTFKHFWSSSPSARRGLSAPAAAEGPTVVDPGRRLQDSVAYSFVRTFTSIVQVVTVYESVSSYIDVQDYIEVCRCGGAQSFTCVAMEVPLLPNDELRVCLWSSSAAVNVDSIDSLVLTQGPTTLEVIEDDDIRIKAITTREYVPGHNGVVVATRVPSDMFMFAAGRSLTISGRLTTMFAGSGRRGLGFSPGISDERDLQAINEEAPFKLEVTLAAFVGEEGAPKVVTLTNSAAVLKNNIVAMGAVFSLVYNLLR